tara:strand:- start:1585 stop:1905 length:321 start_codon:yes stop_codon:yes gene_type:complete
MSKNTGKITKVEKFYIENNSDKTVEDLAKDLNRPVSFVKKHSTVDAGHTDTVQDEKSNVGKLMGHKEDGGVTIMTPAASEAADQTRPSRVKITQRHKNAIHIIKKK